MTTLRYAFRPSLMTTERTLTLDETGARLAGGRHDQALRWTEIEEVHIEPAIAGDDDRPRWLVNLRGKPGGGHIQIDSVNVRGTDDFEHKTKEFSAVLTAIHRALAPRRQEVRFLFGMRRGIAWAWRIALALLVVAGLLASAAAVYSGEWEGAIGGLGSLVIGLGGISALRGRGAPRSYDPSTFALDDDDDDPDAAWRTGHPDQLP